MWRCEYCGAECETPACKWYPGAHPMREVFYRLPGERWQKVDRMPKCLDDLRVPLTARAFIRANLDLTLKELGRRLGVPPATSRTWRVRIMRADAGLPLKGVKKVWVA